MVGVRYQQVPSNLVPRYPIDWRNGGRALMVAAMHRLEGNFPLLQQKHQPLLERQRPLDSSALIAVGDASVGGFGLGGINSLGRRSTGRAGSAASAAAKRLILRHRRSLQWQEGGYCSGRCASSCSKSPWRCLCAWRCRGVYEHMVRMDEILMSYKGRVETEKPLFAVKHPEAICKE